MGMNWFIKILKGGLRADILLLYDSLLKLSGLFFDDKTAIFEFSVKAVGNNTHWELELEQNAGLVKMQPHNVDNIWGGFVLEDENILRDVPVGAGFRETALKNKVAALAPHLEQVLQGVVAHISNVFVLDRHEYGTKVSVLLVRATVKDLVEVVKWNLEHHLLHEFLWRLELVLVVQGVLFMLVMDRLLRGVNLLYFILFDLT